MDPRELVGRLNEYLRHMSDVVLAHRGVVNKFIGDSVMAVFGDPLPSVTPEAVADDAARAVRSALGMRRRLAELNAEWEAQGLGIFRMRVGIFTGPLVAGSVGGRERLEYTVIGDTVNTASRLESFDKKVMDPDIAADGCRILIGARTRELAGPTFRCRRLGEVALKGRDAPAAVFGVIDEAGDPAGEGPAASPEPGVAAANDRGLVKDTVS